MISISHADYKQYLNENITCLGKPFGDYLFEEYHTLFCFMFGGLVSVKDLKVSEWERIKELKS